MENITIQAFTSSQIQPVMKLQSAYTEVYPEAPVIPGEQYLSPAFEGGQNVFCAVDERGELVGYAPLYPVLMRDVSSLPHILWAAIKMRPDCEASQAIKDRLFQQLLIRAEEVTRDVPGHPVHLTFQYFPSEATSIDFVRSKGCAYTESVFTMRRDLTQEIARLMPAEGIAIHPWRMETAAEQKQYVQARNECFPEAPITVAEWQYFMRSPHWSVGTTLAAFDGEELVGNVALFSDEAENERSGKKIGFTEYIFVRPGWRGRNIARCLITAGLMHLKDCGLAEAHLEVRACNQSALGLYVDLGYETIRESRFFVLSL